MRQSFTTAQNGNALWFILVAIVMLGALTMLLTRSGTNVNQSGDVEQMRVRGSEIMRWAKGLESAIDQMKMRGVSESQISFEHTGDATYVNPSCSINDCKVFATGGGGQNYRAPPAGSNDGTPWIFTGSNNVGTTAYPIGSTAARTGNDIVLLLKNANPDLCVQINRDLSVGTSGTLPEDGSGTVTDPFTGTFDNALKIIDGDTAPFELDGKAAGCFVDTNASPNVTYFYYVLLAR